MSHKQEKPEYLYIMYNPHPPLADFFMGESRKLLRKSAGKYRLGPNEQRFALKTPPASLVKIGITNNPTSRFETLQKEYPWMQMLFVFSLPDRKKVYALEQKLHTKYDARNVEFILNDKKRTEWFAFSLFEARILIANLNNKEFSLLGFLSWIL